MKLRFPEGLVIGDGAKVVFYVKNVVVEKNEYELCPDRVLGIKDLRFEYSKENRA